jgi:dTMP kinase
MNNNLFIALEGIDGSGKSTQARLLTEKLQQAGHKVHCTFEPTNGMVGATLRNILRGNIKADERVIAGLFLADRLDHLLNEETGLIKKMQDGYTIITDRYYFSSYAYNGTHMDINWVIEANSICAQILRPDVNIFIDLAPETSMQRISANRAGTELYETLENLRNVRNKYMEAFEKLKHEERILIIDGSNTPEAIADNIWSQLSGHIKAAS